MSRACELTPHNKIVKIQGEIKSNLMCRTLPYCALLPSDYENSHLIYPILYLLHGLFGRFDDWVERTAIAEYAADHQLIIVMPEGSDGWYSDSATVETDKYESYLSHELIPAIDKLYRTIADRRGRAVAGLSMGGYGAFKLGVKEPEMFALVASTSGAFDPARRSDETPGLDWENLRPSILRAFGETGSHVRADNDLHRMIEELPTEKISALPYFYFDCGTEDSFLSTNRELADIFSARNIAHQFQEIGGGHDWDYWDQRVRTFLSLASEKLAPAEAMRGN